MLQGGMIVTCISISVTYVARKDRRGHTDFVSKALRVPIGCKKLSRTSKIFYAVIVG